jgi:hypothetical protein
MTRPDPTRTTAETPPQPEAAAPGSLLGTAVAVGAGVLGAGIVGAALAPALGGLVQDASLQAEATPDPDTTDDWDLGLGDLFDL